MPTKGHPHLTEAFIEVDIRGNRYQVVDTSRNAQALKGATVEARTGRLAVSQFRRLAKENGIDSQHLTIARH